MSGSGSFHIKTQLPKTVLPIRFSDKSPAPQTCRVSRGFPNCYPLQRTPKPYSCLYGEGPVNFASGTAQQLRTSQQRSRNSGDTSLLVRLPGPVRSLVSSIQLKTSLFLTNRY